jgi:sorting nexin-4
MCRNESHWCHSCCCRLELFLKRLGRHPTLQRSSLLQAFFESTEWVRVVFPPTLMLFNGLQTVHMHQQIAHPPAPDGSSSILDNLSDTLLNAFTRLRKPDDRFLQMRDDVERFEEGVQSMDRLWNRVRTRSQGSYDMGHRS